MRYRPSSPSYAWNSGPILCRRARNTTRIRTSTFEICFDFPERNTSEGRKERFPSRKFRPAGWVWSPTIVISDFRDNNMGTFSGRVGRYCPSPSGGGVVRDLVFFFGVVSWGHPGPGRYYLSRPGHLPGGGGWWYGDLGTSFLRRGACGWAVAASVAPCPRMWAWLRGGTNRSDIGLNLSGSWQQGHSATYNTPSRT